MRRLLGSVLSIGLGLIAIGVLIDLIGRQAAPIVLAHPDRPGAAHAANLLINPGFEDGFYYYPGRDSIRVPNGWQIRWYTDTAPVPDWGTPEQFRFYQPETNVISVTEWPYCCASNMPPRIHSGQHAVESGKRYGNQDVSFYQSVSNIPIGAVVTASAWLQAWVSSCNPFPTDGSMTPDMALSLQGPNDADCPAGFWADDSNHMLVGIDPTGGTEPRAPTVVWNWDEANPWWGPYDYYSSTVPVVTVAQAHTVTLFLRAVTIMPAKFNAAYFDDASLEYSFPISFSAAVEGQWPLPVTATLAVQTPVSLTQVTATVDSGEPIEWVDTTETNATSFAHWRFVPQQAGRHIVTLSAAELAAPIVQTVDVPVIPLTIQQDQLLLTGEVTDTQPVWITLTLHSPITLSEPTATLTDPLGLPLSITLNFSEFLDPIIDYQWSFTTAITGWHTVSLSATEFTQPLTRSILAANARVYLPISMRNFSAP
ncbi:MAG: hypothetical protein KA765_07330 [Thermoflexales bacterium]|nr:hypothetical protein [Thermoflexales bacterium]